MSHNIKLKDNQGNDVTYSNVSEINLLDTDGNEVVFGEKKTEQTKTITPTTSEQVVIADDGYELSQVKVEAIQTEEKTVTKNGEYTPTEGKYLTKVTVNVENVQSVLQEKSVIPTKSSQEVIADSGYDGLSKITVAPIPDEYIIPTLVTKNITENGTYNSTDDNADGYSVVTVDVQPDLQEKTVTPTKALQEISSDNNYDGLSKVSVGAIPDEYIIPSGTLAVTENGTYDITEYADVEVNISNSSGGDATDLDYIKYHDNMIQIETGRTPPTDTEYEEIINKGYNILDYVFGG